MSELSAWQEQTLAEIAAAQGVDRARLVISAMLSANGCQWHKAQTHQSLGRYLIEEAHEVLDAIDNNRGASALQEELGDVLYQVLLHAEIAAINSEFTLNDVAENLAAKLIARHPHVFASLGQKTAAELDQMWEKLKENAAGETKELYAGIPGTLPALLQAQKMAERLKRAGRDPLELLNSVEVVDTASAYAAELAEVVARGVRESVDMDQALRTLLAGQLAAEGAADNPAGES